MDWMALREFFENHLDGFRREDVRRFRQRPAGWQRDVIHRVDQEVAAIGDSPTERGAETTHDDFERRLCILTRQLDKPVLESSRRQVPQLPRTESRRDVVTDGRTICVHRSRLQVVLDILIKPFLEEIIKRHGGRFEVFARTVLFGHGLPVRFFGFSPGIAAEALMAFTVALGVLIFDGVVPTVINFTYIHIHQLLIDFLEIIELMCYNANEVAVIHIALQLLNIPGE